MKQKWKRIQFVEISIHEIFCLQDRLYRVKDNPEKVWGIFNDFLMDCENQLELDSGFIRELQELELDKDFITLKDLNDFEKLFEEDIHYKTAKDYVEYITERK